MKIRLGKAIGFGVLLWAAGFVWGTVVFMTPPLKAIPSIPIFSRYPAISFPLLVLFPLMAKWFAPRCIETSGPGGGLPPVGLVLAGTNVLLDAVILVGVFRSSWEYFSFLSVWIAYALVVAAAQSALKRIVPAR
jgi:hypothetical protein